jgi:ABC-2 type transport system ATP-binding protein
VSLAEPSRSRAIRPRARHDVDDAVRVEGLSFSYGEFTAVREVDLRQRRGEVFALLGTNGAGKTTTLDLIQGFRRPTKGTVRVLGLEPAAAGPTLRRRTGAILQQAGFMPELTVRETVQMCAALSSRHDDVDICLDRVELAHRANVPVASLSGGERRRLDIATATWGGPELVIMDEPTTGLDPASRRTLWRIVRDLRAAGTSILLTTHYLEEVEALSDRLAIMHAGRVAVEGTLEDVLATRPSLVTAELDPGVRPPHVPGLTAEPAPDDPRRTRIRVECSDLQETVFRMTAWARSAGVRMHRLRATSASLEDVFHAVRMEEFR